MKTLIMGLGLAVALPAAAQDFNWSGRLAAGQTLEVRGINGAIDAVAASGGDARVTARKTANRRGNPDEVQIVAMPSDDGMVICAVYPDNDPEDACRPGGRGNQHVRNNDVEVHFRVEVPAGVRLVAHTVNGDVDLRDLRSDVEAGTVNGDLFASTTGLAEGSTVNGSVRVRMGRADWTGSAEFTTVNGSVTVEMPGDVVTDFEAQTVNGGITSDFPITIRGRFGPRRATGTIGGGGSRSLILKTVNGDIELHRS